MKLINILGYLLISLPFVAIIVIMIQLIGLLPALSILGASLLIMGTILLGAYLATK